jgi:cellobiose phosphorylase
MVLSLLRLVPRLMAPDTEARSPLRAELFSVEQLERHARELSAWHRVDSHGGRNLLLARLVDNQEVLERTQRLLRRAAEQRLSVPPAGEWLLDNFYLLEEQIRTVRLHLPRRYSRELPRLRHGPHARLPRVYALALELISHLDGKLDEDSLVRFVAAYQEGAELTLGELWAVPIMLRLALVENLRRIAARLEHGLRQHAEAARWTATMVARAEHSPSDLVLEIADLTRSGQDLEDPAFAAEFTRRLHGQNPALAIVLGWYDQRLAHHQMAVSHLVQADAQAAATDLLATSNSIGSLRILDNIDWRTVVEGLSAVEKILLQDPSGIHGRSDFGTRDLGRHAVERIARRCGRDEPAVARAALEAARAAPAAEPAHVLAHHLIGPGRHALERALGQRPSPEIVVESLGRAWPLGWYLGPIALLTAAGAAGGIAAAAALAGADWTTVAAWAGAPLALVASQWAVAMVNWLVTLTVRPRPLPRLDFRLGIPAECATLVVVPALIRDRAGVDELIDGIEVRHLACRDRRLGHALLSDFADAPAEHMPGDIDLLAHACARVEALNRRYRDGGGFFLLHRPRRWNPRQGVWMGHERKRGKLEDLNALLLAGARERFSAVVGEVSALRGIRYVITLDADSRLPRDSARKLVETMAHPLNRARHHPVTGVVVAGHAILQPLPAISVTSAGRSRFASWFCGDAGLDPYTHANADVYQDAFDEGSFVGKGIYDVAAVERAFGGRFPDDAILSHDLIEGSFARAGLVSDVQVVEDFPALYPAEMARRKRWLRGDWQLLPWLMPWIPTVAGRARRNPLSWLAQWKMLDNLRRSLVAPALLALLAIGWTALGATGWWWDLIAIVLLASPALLAASARVGARPRGGDLGKHVRHIAREAGIDLGRTAFGVATLPFEAVEAVDGILTTCWRVFVTRRRMLVWQTADDAARAARRDLPGLYATMWVCPALALTALVAVARLHPENLAAALPLAALWALSPLLCWWAGRPPLPEVQPLADAARADLLRLARRTWRFFERYIGPDDHFLPPDNLQESPSATPGGTIAHRTSPTNIGLSLLADLAAWDFGFATLPAVLNRLENATRTITGLERHRGHLYNWYDTRSLRPLEPLYVSMVDSGNLAGHLWTLRQGLLELPAQPLLPPQSWTGLRTTLDLAVEALGADHPYQTAAIRARLNECAGLLAQTPADLREAMAMLRRLVSLAHDPLAEPGDDDARWWVAAFARACQDLHAHLAAAAPWSELPETPAAVLAGLPSAHAADPAIPGADLRPLAAALAGNPSPADIVRLHDAHGDALAALLAAESAPAGAASSRLRRLHDALVAAADHARAAIARIDALAAVAANLAEMDFAFLFDRTSELFAIGYHVAGARLDRSSYDLLASEARLGSFVAIATAQVGQEHWFSLGRTLVRSGGNVALASWSGTMFEYLMPMLVMPSYERTLLHETARAVVAAQVRHGRRHHVAWGVSESAYNLTDAQSTYQYRAFGIPGLGLKRGLGDDLVIAPYAAVMALMVDPMTAWKNLQRLAAEGCAGRYGLYEAVDFTPARLPSGRDRELIHVFMVHHQGMSLLALAHALLGQPMQRRFLADPRFRATELLLHERLPQGQAGTRPDLSDSPNAMPEGQPAEAGPRVITNPDLAAPEVNLLSNGRYHVLVTAAGGGSSRWNDLAVNRWREDATRDCWGMFCYLRDIDAEAWWSTTHQPSGERARAYEAIFSQGRAEFRRHDHGIDAHTEIAVSPEDDIELRRTVLTNRSGRVRVIEITSYSEVVIAPAAADEAHPAFSNLFVETRVDAARGTLFATRRPRRAAGERPCLFHLMRVEGIENGAASWETDRARFLGRNHGTGRPAAMAAPGDLSGTTGPVLDPVLAIRRRVVLQPDASATIDLVYGMAANAAQAEALAVKYGDRRFSDRVAGLATTHAQLVLGQLGATVADGQLYARLAGSVVFAGSLRRVAPAVLAQNRRSQSGLWSYGISGDLPIVLVGVADPDRLDLVRRALAAHAWWRGKGLVADLVIWNEDRSVYRQALHDRIMGLVAAGPSAGLVDRPGGVFVRRLEQIAEEDRILLQSAARVVVFDTAGTLEQLGERRHRHLPPPPRLMPVKSARNDPRGGLAPARDLQLANGIGGFTRDGREYIITLKPGATTPLPWVNVLANADFGTVVSESGAAYTWAGNCHDYRLTPWNNDAVSDPAGEAFYLRDEDTGRAWSPSPGPLRGENTYIVRHGFGYTVHESLEAGISCTMTTYVATDAPVKFVVLQLGNRGRGPRRLTATGYVEWVLGELRAKSAPHVATEIDPATGALLARNPWQADTAGKVAFFAATPGPSSTTCDRAGFLGRLGGPDRPDAMERTILSGRAGVGLDPCAALRVDCDLAEGEERQLVFILGAGADRNDALNLVRRWRSQEAARKALEAVWEQWKRLLGAIQVSTPDPALDVLANGWLMYQTIACRFWARSGFSQSGGAFGFRDQLQDAMAMLQVAPWLLREHILRVAGRQFREGDVQHWWHPPSGRGVRTRISDDYLWLPQAVCRYIDGTGDTGVLDEKLPFLTGRLLQPQEESAYDLPGRSDGAATVYEHCRLALEHGLRYGPHGLPLMGAGDWNDGMDRVGIHGQGESVWLAFFLGDALTRFANVARRRGEHDFAETCLSEAAGLRQRIDQHAWDGKWYLRAWFDDGAVLGSATSPECQIDSLPQSWAALSNLGTGERTRTALAAARDRLVRVNDRLIQLFDPPFDQAAMDPGYIKGYVPGVRENGGQYTHAAVWLTMAFAHLGDAPAAWDLFNTINPVRHGDTPERIAVWRAEPYVMAADVYGCAPHIGRGGWTWYTGAAGWMYRLISESLLGLHLEEGRWLRIAPCLPAGWAGHTVHYRYHGTVYHLAFSATTAPGARVLGLRQDGRDLTGDRLVLVDDNGEHQVEIRLG